MFVEPTTENREMRYIAMAVIGANYGRCAGLHFPSALTLVISTAEF